MIKSKELENSFRNYFENLWKIAYAPNKIFESRHKINLYDFINKAHNSLDIFDIVSFEMVHEGRNKIIELLNKNKKIRILLANPESNNFKKRVFL